MVKTELSYNPYLQETKIKFNGREPRINSSVEKYIEKNLQDWVDDIPEIFHDEMNGYDFELVFSGTEADFEEVRNAFERKCIPKGKVRFFHKKKLAGREDKTKRAKDLLEWLDENRNKNFDPKIFREHNSILYEKTYPIKIIQDKSIEVPLPNWEGVSIERINEIDELRDNTLNLVPIVVIVGEGNVKELQTLTKFFKGRNDVSDKQVFFLIDEKLDLNIVTRTLIDLGYAQPQVVTRIDDTSVRKYFELYPQTDYIKTFVKALRKEEEKANKRLKKENEKCEKSFSETHNTIIATEEIIKQLKEADDLITTRDNIEVPTAFFKSKEELLEKINKWKTKKSTITSEDEAAELSVELSKLVSSSYTDFSKIIAKSEDRLVADIKNDLENMYKMAEDDSAFNPVDIRPNKFDIYNPPWIDQELMKLHEHQMVRKKDQGLFFMPKNAGDDLEMEMEITYYTQKWREYAISIVEPMAESLIQSRSESLIKYDKELANAYHNHLTDKITEFETYKEEDSMKLSDEEKQLQIDNNWMSEFEEQLKIIERG